ncbi:hypothetical protein AB1287_22080, partial [Enterobacter asburiae]|uniref:hypothetical protein n=1 Tax=Scandinavium sp. UTDF21-P1B TaxID=3446379 RepID=UPI0034988433
MPTPSVITKTLLSTILLSTSCSAFAFDYANEKTGLTKVVIPMAPINNFGPEAVVERKSPLIVGGYVSDWAQYDRKFDLEKLGHVFNEL